MSNPALSFDVTRLLLEFAAKVDHSTAATLSLVSRELNQWTTPILYHSIHLRSNAKFDKGVSGGNPLETLRRTITTRPLLASRVRCLAFSGYSSSNQDVIAQIILAFPSISSLSVIPADHRIILDIPLPATIRHLTWEAWGLKVRIGSVLQMQNLTHLHIVALSDTKSNQAAMVLPILLGSSTLPQLRKVAFSFPPLQIRDSGAVEFPFKPFTDSLTNLVSNTPNLELCVISFTAHKSDAQYVFPQPAFDMIHGHFHEKVVVVGDGGFAGVDPELLILGNGGFQVSDWQDMSFWERAEDHLRWRNRRRAAGSIAPD